MIGILVEVSRLEIAEHLFDILLRSHATLHVLAMALHDAYEFGLTYLTVAACIKVHPYEKTLDVVLHLHIQ